MDNYITFKDIVEAGKKLTKLQEEFEADARAILRRLRGGYTYPQILEKYFPESQENNDGRPSS